MQIGTHPGGVVCISTISSFCVSDYIAENYCNHIKVIQLSMDLNSTVVSNEFPTDAI